MDFRFIREHLKPGDSVFINEDTGLIPQIYVGFDEHGHLITKEFGEWTFYSWDSENDIRGWNYYSLEKAKKHGEQNFLE